MRHGPTREHATRRRVQEHARSGSVRDIDRGQHRVQRNLELHHHDITGAEAGAQARDVITTHF